MDSDSVLKTLEIVMIRFILRSVVMQSGEWILGVQYWRGERNLQNGSFKDDSKE